MNLLKKGSGVETGGYISRGLRAVKWLLVVVWPAQSSPVGSRVVELSRAIGEVAVELPFALNF